MTMILSVAERGDTAAGALRAKGDIPAVVYGPNQETLQIAVNGKEFTKLIQEAGASTIISLEGLASPVEVLIKEVSFDPVKQFVTHVDLYAVERGKEMTTHVPLELVGEAPAEKNGVGTVTMAHHSVTVTCQPSDLPSEIAVDISALQTAEDKILVRDLVVPVGVTIEDDSEEAVAVVSVAKEQEETEPATVDMDAIEVEQKGKGESAEGVE